LLFNFHVVIGDEHRDRAANRRTFLKVVHPILGQQIERVPGFVVELDSFARHQRFSAAGLMSITFVDPIPTETVVPLRASRTATSLWGFLSFKYRAASNAVSRTSRHDRVLPSTRISN
jgi:hypothetical protein